MKSTKYMSIAVFLAVLALVGSLGKSYAQTGSSVDEDIFPIEDYTFGVDSLQDGPIADGTDFLEMFSDTELGWSVLGLMKFTWQDIEPSEPVNGVHTYVWDNHQNANLRNLDDYMEAIYAQKQVVQLVFLPISTWGTEEAATVGGNRWRIYQNPPTDRSLDDPDDTDWYKAINALVERYDGDGTTLNNKGDAPFFASYQWPRYRLLHRLDIGAEVESPVHWIDVYDPATLSQGITDYFDTLEIAMLAAEDACSGVLVGRAPMLTFDITNDLPCETSAQMTSMNWRLQNCSEATGSDLYDWINATITRQDDFHVMNIHPVGKYTCVRGFVNYLRNRPTGGTLSSSIPICADDYIISPHNGYMANRWPLCQEIFADDYEIDKTGQPYDLTSGENDIEDIFDSLDLGWENVEQFSTFNYYFNSDYYDGRTDFQDQQAGHLVKRLIFGLMSGLRCMYIQPGIDEYDWNDRIYRHGGLIPLCQDSCRLKNTLLGGAERSGALGGAPAELGVPGGEVPRGDGGPGEGVE